MSYSIGIDLGTTYSCVAVYKDSKVEVISNDQGNRTTPSIVAFTENEKLVGDAAKNQAAMNPENTLYDAKRFIGITYEEAAKQNDLKNYPFKIENQNNKVIMCAKYKNEEKKFKPEEISALVLSKMKKIAEDFIGEPIKNAVITVPARFGQAEREATKDAGTIAGLNVLRIINEPTAAAIAYGLDKIKKEQKIIIVDIGGGTADISILELDEGIFEVKATSGDTHFGGQDFTNELVNYCCNDIQKKYNVNIRENARALKRLYNACDRAKITLSSSLNSQIEIEQLYKGIDYTTQITRARFNDLCAIHFNKIVKLLNDALSDAKYSKKDVDEIVMVGGSSRIPRIQEIITEYFNGKKLNCSINPDECVAYGASIQAAILSGNSDEKINDILLLDVTPLTLSIVTQGTISSPLIPRGSTIPCKKTQEFVPAAMGQTQVEIVLTQGERKLSKDNKKLGTFMLSGLKNDGYNRSVIEISIDVDANSIVTVSAKEKGTNNENHITVTNTEARLSQEEIDEMIKQAEQFKEEDEKQAQRIEAKGHLENSIFSVKQTINDEKLKDKLKQEDKDTLENKCKEILDWCDNNPNASKEDFEQKQKELDDILNPIIKDIYKDMPNNIPNMPNGMPNIPMGPNGMPDLSKLSPEQQAQLQEMMQNMMKQQPQQPQTPDNNGPKIEELD